MYSCNNACHGLSGTRPTAKNMNYYSPKVTIFHPLLPGPPELAPFPAFSPANPLPFLIFLINPGLSRANSVPAFSASPGGPATVTHPEIMEASSS
jgi:hypothetical protein